MIMLMPSGLQVLPDVDCVVMLEQEIDRMEASLKPLDSFLLPGGNIVVPIVI